MGQTCVERFRRRVPQTEVCADRREVAALVCQSGSKCCDTNSTHAGPKPARFSSRNVPVPTSPRFEQRANGCDASVSALVWNLSSMCGPFGARAVLPAVRAFVPSAFEVPCEFLISDRPSVYLLPSLCVPYGATPVRSAHTDPDDTLMPVRGELASPL